MLALFSKKSEGTIDTLEQASAKITTLKNEIKNLQSALYSKENELALAKKEQRSMVEKLRDKTGETELSNELAKKIKTWGVRFISVSAIKGHEVTISFPFFTSAENKLYTIFGGLSKNMKIQQATHSYEDIIVPSQYGMQVTFPYTDLAAVIKELKLIEQADFNMETAPRVKH